MSETKQKNNTTNGCPEDDGKQDCCERMFTMMQMFKEGEKGNFDCAAMMEKMSCASQQKSE